MLKNLEERLVSDVLDLKTELRVFPDLPEKTKEIKKTQIKIQDSLEEVIQKQRIFGEYFLSHMKESQSLRK